MRSLSGAKRDALICCIILYWYSSRTPSHTVLLYWYSSRTPSNHGPTSSLTLSGPVRAALTEAYSSLSLTLQLPSTRLAGGVPSRLRK
jgi:hypothetical protein